MSDSHTWRAIEQAIQAQTGTDFCVRTRSSVGGGSINSAYLIGDDHRQYFAKLNRASLHPMFAAEAQGLEAIAQTNTVQVPKPVCYGVSHRSAFLILESLQLKPHSADSERQLGECLARMHRVRQTDFGWFAANWIGSTPQPNEPNDNWADFWRHQRLGFQLQLAAEQGYGGRLQQRGELLLERFTAFFSDYTPRPSLLHGDLWSGNHACDAGGEPVIFDPACYRGDQEADLAMTELFGRCGRDFYAAYQAVNPLDRGYGSRKILYNLYHILNHLNLFGSGYLSQAEQMMDALLAELG